MPAHLDDIRTGQDVYGLDGEKLGSVTRVWNDVSANPGVLESTRPAGDVDGAGINTGDQAAGDILGQVEARGTNAGDVGTSAGTEEASGAAAPRSPSEVSPAGLGIQGYLKIGESGGILGIGAKNLYVPFSAVRDVAEDCVTLEVTQDQAKSLYSSRPEFLDDKS